MKIYTADFRTENNAFSPLPTSYRDFEERMMVRNGDRSAYWDGYQSVIDRFRKLAEESGHDIVMGLDTHATPSGRIVRFDYERIRDEILDGLKAAMPVDMVMLHLHGAMAAYGYDDCEGDILSRARSIVGPDVVIGVELDPHCHLTDAMVDSTTFMVFYKEQPHIDVLDRAADVFSLAVATAKKQIKPVMSVFDCRMINAYMTLVDPMKSFIDKLKQLEGHDDVLSISIVHSFPPADNPDIGIKVLVVTDDNKEHGDALAKKLGMELWDMREETMPVFLSADEAIDEALSMDEKPVMLIDFSDNQGGGSPGDSTFILSKLLEQDIPSIFGYLWDPFAVSIARAVGEGEEIDIRIGGRVGPLSGPSLDVRATVQHVPEEGAVHELFGDVAVIRVGQVYVVMSSKRMTPEDCLEEFEAFGLEPMDKKIISIKSPYAAPDDYPYFLMVHTPAAIPVDMTKTSPYKNMTRTLWPFDPDPFGTGVD